VRGKAAYSAKTGYRDEALLGGFLRRELSRSNGYVIITFEDSYPVWRGDEEALPPLIVAHAQDTTEAGLGIGLVAFVNGERQKALTLRPFNIVIVSAKEDDNFVVLPTDFYGHFSRLRRGILFGRGEMALKQIKPHDFSECVKISGFKFANRLNFEPPLPVKAHFNPIGANIHARANVRKF
jgi:hypothetical protein